MLKNLSFKKFKLFKDLSITFGKLNIIKGDNGVGKSTIIKGILFGLYGVGCGNNLQRLISFGEKSTEVKIEFDKLDIIRKIPQELMVFEDGEEIERNTPTLKQNEIDNRIGNYEFFRKYRLINNQAVNLLDYAKDSRSIITLRKELMNFIDDVFSSIRQDLLNEKLGRENKSVNKRLYKFHLSEKRLKLLEDGLKSRTEDLLQSKQSKEEQNTIINGLKNKETTSISQIEFLNDQENINLETINKNKKLIEDYQIKINNLKNIPVKEKIKIVDYDSQLLEIENNLAQVSQEFNKIETSIETNNKEIEDFHFKEHTINTSLEEHRLTKQKIHKEINGLDDVKIGTKCDKCGSIVSIEYKESYKKEKLQTIANLIAEEQKLNESLKNLENQISQSQKKLENLLVQKSEINNKIESYNKQTKSLNFLKFEQAEKIKSQESEKMQIESNIIKYVDLINTCKEQIQTLVNQNIKNNEEIKNLKNKVETIKSNSINEKEVLDCYNENYNLIENKKAKTQEYIMKLKEAFKFKDYCFSKKDIEIYTNTIKVFDEFASWYIQQWLDNLTFIINGLLKPMSLEISFSADKQFMTILNEGQENEWNDLSGGQQIFLNVVFKLSILLHNGIIDGIVIIDDGINDLKEQNMLKLVEVLKSLPFQFFLIYQNIPPMKNVNVIEIERKGNESKVK